MRYLICLLISSSASAATNISETFVKIKAGTFLIGSPQDEADRFPDEGPQHRVIVSNDFEIQATEVTQAQWVKVMRTNPSVFKTAKFCPETIQVIGTETLCPDFPVENMSFDMLQTFLIKTSDQDYDYRLPTEPEWELAARGGTTSAYFFGNDASQVSDYAWWDNNSNSQTHSVALKKPNQFGLYDTAGNVAEWLGDLYAYYPGSTLPVPDAPPRYVVRGGSWFTLARNLRSAFRYGAAAYLGNESIGFRMVREKTRAARAVKE